MNNDYLKLTKAFDRYYILKKINSTLSWDTQVKMPKDGFYIREKQLNLINQEIDVEISQALEKVRSQGDLRKEGVVRKSTQAQTQAYQQAEKKITKFQELLAVRLEEQEARVSQEAKRITQVLFSELSKA
mgnify:CR=1 FL=1